MKKGKKRVYTPSQLKSFREYQAGFIKDNYVAITCRFSKKEDKAVITKLHAQENITDYIRVLVLKDINKRK